MFLWKWSKKILYDFLVFFLSFFLSFFLYRLKHHHYSMVFLFGQGPNRTELGPPLTYIFSFLSERTATQTVFTHTQTKKHTFCYSFWRFRLTQKVNKNHHLFFLSSNLFVEVGGSLPLSPSSSSSSVGWSRIFLPALQKWSSTARYLRQTKI